MHVAYPSLFAFISQRDGITRDTRLSERRWITEKKYGKWPRSPLIICFSTVSVLFPSYHLIRHLLNLHRKIKDKLYRWSVVNKSFQCLKLLCGVFPQGFVDEFSQRGTLYTKLSRYDERSIFIPLVILSNCICLPALFISERFANISIWLQRICTMLQKRDISVPPLKVEFSKSPNRTLYRNRFLNGWKLLFSCFNIKRSQLSSHYFSRLDRTRDIGTKNDRWHVS